MKVGKKKWKSKGEGGCLVLGRVSEKHLPDWRRFRVIDVTIYCKFDPL